jgi:maltooligosyltrehalose synthase
MQRFPGGKREFSIKFIQGRFRTQTATESAIYPESSIVCSISATSASMQWLSPIFPPPMADFGYDIFNYLGIDPIFGTLDDFDTLVAAAHATLLQLMPHLTPQ